jgi:Phage tail tube protein
MPAPPSLGTWTQEGLLVFSGAYGSAWRDGQQLGDVIEASGAVEVARIDIPLVGQTRIGHKPGRETREGTMRVQKRDAQWEMEVFQFLSQSLAERRRARDAGQPLLRPFSLILEFDDPYALGRERWQLDGVLIWRMPLGFALGDDAIEREYPITWETERPLEVFRKEVGPGGVPVPQYMIGPTP